MQFSAVAFVLTETILGKLRAKVTHYPVPGDFCDHARRGDAEAHTIAIDDGRLRNWKRNNRKPVDEHMIRGPDQSVDSLPHRPMTRSQNIDSINFDMIDNADCPGDLGVGGKIEKNFLAPFGQELFGIV